MTLLDLLTQPFTDYAFMRRALAAGLILVAGGVPLGVFMMLRRMTLVGDALAHAVLPGIALAFLVAGLSVWAMALGGLIAAIVMALGASFLVRHTRLKEDSAFSLLYLLALACGVALLSVRGSGVNLMHLLFGNILAVDRESLFLVASVSVFSLFSVAALYRRFVIDGFDPTFLTVAGRRRRGVSLTRSLFFVLLMVNLVAAFQAMGTLMALGLVLLPGIGARFWGQRLEVILPIAVLMGFVSVYVGLLFSYYGGLPSGPAIVLVAGGMALFSALTRRW